MESAVLRKEREKEELATGDMVETNKPGSKPLLEILRGRRFRLFVSGQAIARFGDQFYLIALPWLVLRLTGDPLAMGTVLAVAGIPRALLMLVGGVLTDRFSSRSLMLGTDIMRMVLVALLAVLVLKGGVQLWMIYVFAVTFGVVDAFFYPALNSMVPHLVKEEQLQAGNAIVQGTGQIALFAGPVAAGLLIAILDGGRPSGAASGSVPDILGIGIAFAFNALTFLASVITLWLMKGGPARSPGALSSARAEGVWASIREGLVYVKNDGALSTFFLIMAAVTFLINGPMAVGVPVLAESRFSEGAAAFGIIMSAFGGGMLAGTLLAGILPRPAPSRFGPVSLLLTAVAGAGMALLGFVSSTILAAAVSAVMGLTAGYVSIQFITWLQGRTPQAMLGRMMGLLMFAMVGLNPISTVLAGALIKLNTTALFAGAGCLVVLFAIVAVFTPAVRGMGLAANVAGKNNNS